MTDIRATATGVWSNASIWNGGVVPTTGDSAFSNLFVITIDQDFTCNVISNAAGGGGVTGGGFVLDSGRTITANVVGGWSNATFNTACLRFGLASPGVANIVGHVLSGASNNLRALDITANGTLNIIGGVASQGSPIAINANAACVINVTGNMNGGTSGDAFSAILAGAVGYTLNVTGNMNGGTLTGRAVNATVNCAISVTGFVDPGMSGTGQAISATGANTVLQVVGDITAGPFAHGINLTGATSTANVAGSISASASYNGLFMSGASAQARITGPCYNGFGSANFSKMAIVCAAIEMTPSANGLAWRFYANDDITAVNLYYANGLPNLPATDDVRDGVTYGSGGALEGTLVVPVAGEVSFGVNYDNGTIGTAILTKQAIADAIGPLIEALGP